MASAALSAPILAEPRPLKGVRLLAAAFALALANFVVVLDSTIANVSVPHIAGGLAVSPTQGTWVITSYAVADAISVPLTGWLAARFGTVRWFLISIAGRSEEHTSELQSLMRTSYAVFCLKKKMISRIRH